MKVILVDDNFQMLTFMDECIPWASRGIEVIGKCENGEDALQLASYIKPDILVTDIDMPNMNGLELIRKMKELYPKIQSLIISSHEDFQYAQQAVRLLVSDYILKEDLEPETLLAAIDKLVGNIKLETQQLNESIKWKSLVDQNKFSLKRQWLRNLVDSPSLDEPLFLQRCQMYGLELTENRYLPVVGQVMNKQNALDKFKSTDLLMYAVDNIAQELFGENFEGFVYEQHEMIWFFPVKDLVKFNVHEEIKHDLSKLQEALFNYTNIEMAFVYHKPVRKAIDLKKSLEDLIKLKHEWFYMDDSGVSSHDIVKVIFASDDLFDDYTTVLEEMRKIILEEDEKKLVDFVKSLITTINKRKYHPDSVKIYFHKIVVDIGISYYSLNKDSTIKTENIHSEFHGIQTVKQLELYVIRYLTSIIKSTEVRRKSQRNEIWKATKYVETHIHEKITMEKVAQHLYLNPSYFSRIFKKETGDTFIDYVNRAKIEKAYHYLVESNNTVEDIASRLGYDNTSYFIKLFKKYTNKTPAEYRHTS
ncbi:response regulator transcription factor [Halalkalibacter urbisdiaboli]|uniref:response regulator transcription factor n=1 Tax=Halalkalibacter urbisdiaboli TaxID=1960589 RepID=UPI000B42FA2F|nr:AraC family transcriptional regulator [Halalkalibacter urbisdiaboli]